MFTVLKERRRRRSSFAEAMGEDSSWSLQRRMAAKSRRKGLTAEEMVEQARQEYETLIEEELSLSEEEAEEQGS